MPKQRPGPLHPRLLVPILLFALAGCAYYNTFYLARRYYKEAQKEQERSVSGAVAAGAASRYDQVVRQCMKVITDYPKSKWVDDAMYLMGASLYGKGDYAGAIRRLDELETKFPKSSYVPEARLVKGLAHYRRKDYETADSILTAMSEAYPKHPRRWELYFYEGESRAAQRDYAGSLPWYRRAIGVADDRREKSDALRRAGDALFEAERMDSAQAVYAEALKQEERPGPRLDIALKRADALREVKRYKDAAAFIGPWRPIALAENREGEVLLRIYELEAFQGKPKDAIKGYQELAERFPGTNVAYEAQFQIGYLYETSLGDVEQAAREYEKLRAFASGNNQFATQAVRRSQSLTTLKQFRQQMAADTTGAVARTAFRLAEVYYFELGKTDSALAQYRSVESLYPGSVYAPKSAYARLWIAAYDRGDTLDAMRLTDVIASRYRGTRYAESALYLWKRWSGRTDERTALFDSLLANPDTSGASRYAEEPEPQAAPDSLSSVDAAPPDSNYQVSPALMESLRRQAEVLQKRREYARQMRRGERDSTAAPADTASGGGVPPPPGSGSPSPPPPIPPAPADSTRSSAPPDTTRRSAPADTTRGAAPPDTSGTKR